MDRPRRTVGARRRSWTYTVVYVYSDTEPGPGFEPAEPDLEDVYFSTMVGHIGRRGQSRRYSHEVLVVRVINGQRVRCRHLPVHVLGDE